MDTVITAQIHRNDDRFGACYDLLYGEFGTAELDTADRLRASLNSADPAAPQGFLLARYAVHDGQPRWDDPVGVIAGDYLPLPGGGCIGALGHLVASDRRRGAGHGAALVGAWERAVRQHARRHRQRMRLLVLESRPTATTFWAQQGYRWVAGSEYRQPVIVSRSAQNHSDSQLVPELLMVKTPGTLADDVDTALIVEAVFTMYRHWYEPPCAGTRPDIWARITAELWGRTFPAFLSSLPPAPQCPITHPPSQHNAATAA